jgi:hypothetical protein
MGMSKPH